MLSKTFIHDSKELKTLKLSDMSFCLHSCTTKCTGVSPLHAIEIIALLGHKLLFDYVDFISDMIAPKFLVRLNLKVTIDISNDNTCKTKLHFVI